MTTKLQKKIFINISIIMILFLAGLIFIFSRDSYHKMAESRKNNLLVLSAKTTDAFTSLLQDMDAIAIHITSNTAIRDAFNHAQKESLTNSELYNAIKSDFVFLLVPVDTSRFRINIYNAEGNYISAGIPYSNSHMKDFMAGSRYPEYYNSIVLPKSKMISGFTDDLWSDSGNQYLSLYRELSAFTKTKKRMALIDIQCGYNTIDAILSLTQSDTTTLLLNDHNQLVYASMADDTEDPELLLSAYNDRLDSLLGHAYQDKENLVTATQVINGWHLVFIQSLRSPTQMMGNYMLLIVVTTIICLVSAIFVVFIVIKYNMKPLQTLTNSVKELSLTSPYLDIDTSKYSDEMVNLTESFNQMVNKLTVSMEENVRAREYEMRANLVALQSQMDPHFLYNMLSVIDSYDREEDFDNIHQICIYMSSMLRYISSYMNNTATLEMELEHTKHYLHLMKFRFENQFHFEITIAPEMNLSDIQIPRLILQPILENCFQHGFKKVLPPWHISLSFRLDETGGWLIDIRDNGCGFSPENQRELRKKIESFADSPLNSIESLKIGGMGLVNTLIRIQIYLSNSFHYEIFLPPEGGTCIRLGGKQHDEHYTD